jgi:hypothetical protein
MTSAESAETAAVRRMAERERLSDERELLADLRDAIADERELLADERERGADERERVADELGDRPPATEVRSSSGGAVDSRLRLLQSARGLESAQLALERARATLARGQVAVGQEANAARQEDLTVAREMQSSKISHAQQAHVETS